MSAWSCSFTKHELHLRVTAKCCKSFFLALKTRFTPLQSFSCACKFYLRLQSYVHFHKSYHTHANLLGVKLPSNYLHTIPHSCIRQEKEIAKLISDQCIRAHFMSVETSPNVRNCLLCFCRADDISGVTPDFHFTRKQSVGKIFLAECV